MKIQVLHYEGKFNVLDPSEKSWYLGIRIGSDSWLSEIFDEEQDYGDEVGTILNLIAERSKSYWISTSRDEKLKRIAEYQKQLPQLEIAYANQLAIDHQRLAAKHSEKAMAYRQAALWIQEDLDSEQPKD